MEYQWEWTRIHPSKLGINHLNKQAMIIEFWKTGENPITCYNSRPVDTTVRIMPKKAKAKPENRGKTIRVPITVIDKAGKQNEFDSVVLASEHVGMNLNTLYAFLNGRAKNPTEYTIYKSVINN